MRVRIFLILFILLNTAHAIIPDATFETWIKKGMQDNHFPGISIAVIENYKITWAKGFGLANIQKQTPVTIETLFQAASISKPVTAMAALKSVEAGKLTLDENINNKLTSWKIPDNDFTKNNKITLEKLLSHSGGINVPGFYGYAKGDKTPDLLAILNGLPPANSEAIRVTSSPGKKFNYSGGGYTIVEQALIDIYHQPFPRIMNHLVLSPLAMSASTFQQPLPSLITNAALPYYPDGKPVKGGPHVYITGAAAGLWTKPIDLAKFIISIQKSLRGDNNQVLSKHFARLMAIIPASEDKTIHMGLGTMVGLDKNGKLSPGGTWFSHAGQNEGYRNLFIADTKSGNGVIIMTNMSPKENMEDKGWEFIYTIAKYISEIYHWK